MNRSKSRTFKKDKKRLEINRETNKRKDSPQLLQLHLMADSDSESVKNKKEGITNTYLSELDNIILNRVQTRSNSRGDTQSKPHSRLENSPKKSFEFKNRRSVILNQGTFFLRYKSIQQIVPGFIQLLKNKGLIQVNLNACTLETSRLSRICLYLLHLYSDSHSMNDFALRLFTEQQQLTEFLKKSELTKLPSLRKKTTSKLLTYCTSVISQTIPNMSQWSVQTQITDLKNTSQQVKKQLEGMKLKWDELKIELGRKKSQSSHLHYRIEKLNTDLNQLRRQQESTKNRINIQEKVLAYVQQKMLHHRRHCEGQQFRAIQCLAQQEGRLIDSIKLHGSYFRCFPQDKSSNMANSTSCERLLQKEFRQLQRILDDPREDLQKKSAFSAQFFTKSQQQYTSSLEKLQFRMKQKDALINKFLSLIEQLQNLRERKSRLQKQMKQGLCLQQVVLERYIQLDKNPFQLNNLFPEGIMVFLHQLFNNLIMFKSIL